MALIEPKNVTLKNGQKACIRTQTLEDADKVMRCVESTFVNDRFFLMTIDEIREHLTIEKYTERTNLYNEDENKLLLIVDIDGKIVSASNVECGEKNRIRHVGRIGISVLPDYRGVGLGTAILRTMIDWATDHPTIEKLALGVWATNAPAIALYKKMGFVEEGRKVKEVKYADGSYDDCILMYRFVK